MQRLRGVRWSLRNRLAEHPSLYLPIARRKFPDAVLGPDTQLVIEGFTRSAVTFATIAFQLAQHRPVRVSHTLHAVGHVVEAVRRGIPSLVAIREPEAAVLSAIIREPYVTIERALVGYTRFYAGIQPYAAGIVMATFDSLVNDLGRVTGVVNERFGTSFDRFEHTPENVERCYGIIEDRARRVPWERDLGRFQAGMITYDEYRWIAERGATSAAGMTVPEHRVQRPSETREAMKDELRARFEDPRLDALRGAAIAVYERSAFGAV